MPVTQGKWKERAGLGKGKIPRVMLDIEEKQKNKKVGEEARERGRLGIQK